MIAYADNLNTGGADPCKVQAAKDGAVSRLKALGFGVHEDLEAFTIVDSWGFRVDRNSGTVYPTPRRLAWSLLRSNGCRKDLGLQVEQLRNLSVMQFIS